MIVEANKLTHDTWFLRVVNIKNITNFIVKYELDESCTIYLNEEDFDTLIIEYRDEFNRYPEVPIIIFSTEIYPLTTLKKCTFKVKIED